MGGVPEESRGARPVARAAQAPLTRQPDAGAAAFLTAALVLLAGSVWAEPATAGSCSEPPLVAPFCSAAPAATGTAEPMAGEARQGADPACRLALEAYILSLDRWSFCVRNEAALRTLEARRRLDCLARGQGVC